MGSLALAKISSRRIKVVLEMARRDVLSSITAHKKVLETEESVEFLIERALHIAHKLLHTHNSEEMYHKLLAIHAVLLRARHIIRERPWAFTSRERLEILHLQDLERQLAAHLVGV